MFALNQRDRILFLLTVLMATLVVTIGLLHVMAAHAWLPDALATDVGGVINNDTTWALAGSPYILTSDLTVAAGVTLTIEPGVVVMGDVSHLWVAGHLEAIGTTADPITFTSAADTGPGEWSGLYFVGGTGHLDHVVVRYATSSGIWVDGSPDDGPVIVENSVIQDNSGYALDLMTSNLHRLQLNNVSASGNGANRVQVRATDDTDNFLTRNTRLTAVPDMDGYEFTQYNLNVPSGITLTLDPGVVMMGELWGSVWVAGHLEAIGTTADPITFTSAANTGPGEWSGLYFVGGTGHLDHVVVRYATSSGIWVDGSPDDGPVVVENSVIQDNSGYALDLMTSNLHRLQLNNVSASGNGANRVQVRATDDTDNFLTRNTRLTAVPGMDGYEFTQYNLNVPSGITLTLDPGVVMMGELWGSVWVAGHLEAIGTTADPITFTSAADIGPGEWSGIYFVGGSGNLNYVDVRYADTGGNWAIYVDGASDDGFVSIQNSSIHHNLGYPMIVAPERLHKLQLNNVTFTDNSFNRVHINSERDAIAGDVTLSEQPGLDGYEFSPLSLVVPAGVTMTVQAGTTLMATDPHECMLSVEEQGLLNVMGTAVSPVTFTSTSDSAPGEWGEVCVSGTANIDHAEFRYGTDNLLVWGTAGGDVTVQNSTIISSSQYGMLTFPNAVHRLRMSDMLFGADKSDRILIELDPGTESLAGDTVLIPQPGLEGYEVRLWGEANPQLLIPDGLTLTIAPSVTVMTDEDIRINVAGHLAAEGTAVSPVTFTSITNTLPGEWGGLIISGTASLDHAIIRNGQRNLDVQAGASMVSLNNSEIGQASQEGLAVAGGEVTAVCTTFSGNSGDAIYVTGSPDVTVFSSSISDNGSGVNNVGSTAVNARQNWWGDASGPGGEGPGSGDAIWGDVLYHPWLTEPTCNLTPYQLFLPVIIRP